MGVQRPSDRSELNEEALKATRLSHQGPVRRPEPGERDPVKSMPRVRPVNEPRHDAGRDLNATRDEKARAQPVEELYLHPVALERRPAPVVFVIRG